MKIAEIVSATLISAVCCGMVGCTTTPVQTAVTPVENVAVEYAQGRTFASAVNLADVVPVGAKAFSIRMVQSNIPVRKYDQWVNNLSREIVLQASR